MLQKNHLRVTIGSRSYDQRNAMPQKTFISAQQLLEDSFALSAKILDDGFRPSVIIALWRGGTPIGIAVQESLEYHGISSDHIAIRTSSYVGIDGRSNEIRIHGLSYVIKNIKHTDRLLIVDDVFDTGRTIEALLTTLQTKARLNTPRDIRIAVPYYKPARNQTGLVPDYYLHETNAWLKYPHSLEGLSHAEVAEHRPDLFEIIKKHLKSED